jgi:hypothetical protein
MTERRIQENIREITQNEDRIGHSQVLLGSSEATQVIADSTITPIVDSNNRPGWFLKNTVAGTKFNLYIFGGSQEIIKKSDIRSLYFLGNVDNLNDINSIPYLHIYTKPTGSNDHQVWYHTRYTYKVDLTEVKMGLGEQCLFYANDRPIDKPRKYQSQRHIPMSDSTVDGELDEHGEILYITVSSDTAAVVNTMQCCLQMVGFETIDSYTENEINTPVRNFYFKTPETSSTTTSTGISGYTDIGDPNSLVRIEANTLGKLSVNDTELNTKITKGSDDTIAEATGAQQVLIYGKDSTGILRPADTTTTGRLLVDVADINKSGVITVTPSLNSFQVCGYREDTNNFHTIKVTSDGTQLTKDNELNNKISKGDDDTIIGATGAQQVLIYGKNGTNLHPLKIDTDGRLITYTEHIRESEQLIVSTTTVAADTDIGSPINCSDYKFINIYGTATGNHPIYLYTSGDGGFVYYYQETLMPQTINSTNYFYIQTSEHLQYVKLINGNTSNTFTLKYVLSN